MNRSQTVIGITGHQSLSRETRKLISERLAELLQARGNVLGVTSLASGADQIFAECVRQLGGSWVAVIPSAHYETTFSTASGRQRFNDLLRNASQVIELPFEQPTEEAFLAAGKEIVARCDVLFAVWDGEPAAGSGGTADIVQYARECGKPITVIWPTGASRR